MSDENKFNLWATVVMLFLGVIFLWRATASELKSTETSRDYWMKSSVKWQESALWWIAYSRSCK